MQDYLQLNHPRRPRGSQSGREKRRNESFQVRGKEALGTDSHRTISKNSSGCRHLLGHKKILCIIVTTMAGMSEIHLPLQSAPIFTNYLAKTKGT